MVQARIGLGRFFRHSADLMTINEPAGTHLELQTTLTSEKLAPAEGVGSPHESVVVKGQVALRSRRRAVVSPVVEIAQPVVVRHDSVEVARSPLPVDLVPDAALSPACQRLRVLLVLAILTIRMKAVTAPGIPVERTRAVTFPYSIERVLESKVPRFSLSRYMTKWPSPLVRCFPSGSAT